MTTREKTTLALLAVTALAVRLWGAWCFRDAFDSDAGIVGLMARHMAEGRHLPVFFYGQGYMGSFEPMVSALLCRIFGCTGFVVAAGTALLASLAVPVVYLAARRVAGPAAGIAAAIFCLIGPENGFYYQVCPRGGYALLLLCESLLLWLLPLLLAKPPAPATRSTLALHVAVGLVAGLAWWTTQLSTATLMACGLLYAAVHRRALFKRAVLAAVAAFILASAPFWIWNALHDWDTFSFVQSMGEVSLAHGLRLFVTDRMLLLHNLHEAPAWPQIATAAAYGACALAVLLALCRRKDTTVPADRHLAFVHGVILCVLLIMLSALLFARSHFATMNTARYLLPLIPPLAILIGAGIASLRPRCPRGIAWLPLAVLLATQVRTPAGLHQIHNDGRAARLSANELAQTLQAAGCDTVYGLYPDHRLNFMLQERFTFHATDWERYRPYQDRAEHATNLAVLNNPAAFNLFAETTCGGYHTAGEGNRKIRYQFDPPDPHVAPIAGQAFTAMRDDTGTDVADCLSDLTLNTGPRCASGDPMTIAIRLPNPQTVLGVRLFSDTAFPFEAWSIEGRQTGETNWTVVVPPQSPPLYIWSGPRPFIDGPYLHIEARFSATDWIELRFRFTAAERSWRLAELQLLGPAPLPPDAGPLVGAVQDVRAVAAMLRTLGAQRVYADRWVSARLDGVSGLCVVRPADNRNFAPVSIAPGTVLVVPYGYTALVRQFLDRAGVTATCRECGPWSLFALNAAVDTAPRLVWSGLFPLAVTPEPVRITTPADIRFARHIRFHGVRLEAATVKAGERVPLAYHWECPESVDVSLLSVFVHFRDASGKTVFQDDHPLLDGVLRPPEPDDRAILVEERTVSVSPDTPPGTYQPALGICHWPSGKRLNAHTSLKLHDRAVVLPCTITVVP